MRAQLITFANTSIEKELIMTKKLTLWIGAAALSTIAYAAPKTYSVVVSAPMKPEAPNCLPESTR
jgi:hypothetical protein